MTVDKKREQVVACMVSVTGGFEDLDHVTKVRIPVALLIATTPDPKEARVKLNRLNEALADLAQLWVQENFRVLATIEIDPKTGQPKTKGAL